MNRRILCVVMAALLMLTLAGCGGTAPSSASDTRAPDRTIPVATAGPASERLPDSAGEPPANENPETDVPGTAGSAEATASTEAPVSTEAPAETGTPVSTETSPATEPQTDEPEETEPEETEPVEETGEHMSDDFADEQALRDYLTGAWNLYPTNEGQQNTPEIGGIPGLTIQLAPEGMFMAIEHMSFRMYAGTWELERLFADEDEVPDMIRFTLDEPDDKLEAFGEFVIQGWAHCAGSDRLSLVQVNTGFSVISALFDLYDAMLVKGGDFPTDESADPKPDAHFCAMVWQVADDGETLWVTEVDPADFAVGAGSREAVRYHLAEDCEIRCPTSAFVRGGLVAELETNAAGEISMINWAEMEMEG